MDKKPTPEIHLLIEMYNLKPLPVEGSLFTLTYRDNELIPSGVLPSRYPVNPRPFGTAIIFLLTPHPDSFSALHWLPTDEIYHFYLGDPVEMLLLFPDGESRHIVLGQDILNGQKIQFVVPRGVIQGSRLVDGGRWALCGTTMAPGFDETDYLGCARQELLTKYPTESRLINLLTRQGDSLRMTTAD